MLDFLVFAAVWSFCFFSFGPPKVARGCLEHCVQQENHGPFVTAGECEACWLLGSHQPGNAVPDLGPVQPLNPAAT